MSTKPQGLSTRGRPEAPNRAPNLDGSTPVALYVYVEDVDETIERAAAMARES